MTARTQAQRDAQEYNSAALANSVVPKSLRATALFLCRTIPDSERRTHAKWWVRGVSRTRDELESFCEKLQPKREDGEEQ